jgi:serine/threonine protein kinase
MTENRCPACDAELAANAPRGLCPACLLKGGLGTQTGGSNPSASKFVPPTPAELTPFFPELEILELVGRGGMGVVYKARQKRLDRLVALKILSPEIGQDRAFAERFTREARAMGMLNHPHIVAVYDFGQSSLPSPAIPAGGEGSSLPSPVLGRGAGGGLMQRICNSGQFCCALGFL